MLLNFPEPRMEPFEKFEKVRQCPRCGTPADEIERLIYDGDPNYVRLSDIVGCDKCSGIRVIDDPNEIWDILAECEE